MKKSKKPKRTVEIKTRIGELVNIQDEIVDIGIDGSQKDLFAKKFVALE